MFEVLIWQMIPNQYARRAPVREIFLECGARGRKPISALSRCAAKLETKTTNPSAPHSMNQIECQQLPLLGQRAGTKSSAVTMPPMR